jgi:RHS repeat-associated protein
LPLVSVTDRAGHQITIDYDSEGAPVSVTQEGGGEIRVATADGRVTGLDLVAAGTGGTDVPLARYGYGASGELAQVADSSGRSWQLSYDDAGRLTRWQDRNGWSYEYDYDDQGRCVRGEGPDGALSGAFSYNPRNRVTTFTDPAGATTGYQVNDRLQVVAVTDPLGNLTRYEHDLYGRLVWCTDPLGRTTSYAYDAAGNLTEITRADGKRTLARYNELSQPVLVAEPDGASWQQDYDESGNLIRVVAPDGAVMRYSYDGSGHLTGFRDPEGAPSEVECGRTGLPVSVTGPGGDTVRYARDGFGRITAITSPDGSTTGLEWTTEGYLASRTFPDGTAERFAYDGEGNLITHLDPAAHLTRFEYGCFDRITSQTGPDGARTEYSYDHALRLAEVRSSGLTWRYGYDVAGRPVTETDYNGATMHYTYDAAGQLTGRINAAGQQVDYAYDQLGNMIKRHADGSITTYGYDPANRLVRAENADAVIEIERDAAGRIITEACDGYAVRSTYDLAGRRAERTTPSGARTTWEYDAAGQPIALRTQGQELRFGYDPARRETIRELPGGAVLTQGWDHSGRLSSQALLQGTGPDGSQQVLQHRHYSYRADGAVTGIRDLLSGPRRFSLDAVGRAIRVSGPGWAEQYAYDPAGNIVAAAWPVPPGPANAWAGAHAQGGRENSGTLLTRAGDVSYRHDAQGRIVTRQMIRLSRKRDIWHYQWDADDRLTAVTTPDGTTWRYLYDPLGRRIAKQCLTPVGDVAEHIRFAWDGSTLAEQATVASGLQEEASIGDGHSGLTKIITWNYRPGTFTPLTQSEFTAGSSAFQTDYDQRFYAIVTDLIGSPSELVDTDGGLAGYQQHTLWGTTLWKPGGASTPLRFPGQYEDPETGLHYNHYRYYDSVTGCYLTPDPLGLAAGPNPHAYVPNPCVHVDPLGLVCRIEVSPESPDWGTKGAHVKIDGKEVVVYPTGDGGIGLKPFETNAGIADAKELAQVRSAIESDPSLRLKLIRNAESAMEKFNRGTYGTVKNRAAEMHFLIKALEKM